VEKKHRGEMRQPDTAGRVMSLMADLALEKGLDALSMRDVAKRAGISLAALQYHYPSKDALIAAFVTTTLDRYRTEIDAIRAASDTASELRNIVLYAIDQTLDDRTGHIFAMLEARSRHDVKTALAIEGFMQLYIEAMRDAIVRRQPKLTQRAAERAAMRVVAMIEGLASVRSAANEIGITNSEIRADIVAFAEGAA
jgi:AcrR family transcriptional regulator